MWAAHDCYESLYVYKLTFLITNISVIGWQYNELLGAIDPT